MSAFCHKCGDDLLTGDPPDYHQACLVTPANTPGKGELFSATAMNRALSTLTPYTVEDMAKFVQAADAYAAACGECGRMRTMLEVKSLRPLTPEWQTLVINGVGIIEFELGTELAGKVFRALRITSEP